MGIRITGTPNATGGSGLFLKGNQSNTFTGDAEVSGRNTGLVLQKGNNAIAVRGNILIKDGAYLLIRGSNQTLKSSNITLKSNGFIEFEFGENISNKFHNLKIENHSILIFQHQNREYNDKHSKYYIYLDDLIIHENGRLTIYDWAKGRDFLLVRKSSQHLADALRKMEFTGYDPRNIHLKDYNKDYWQISALPEPATYGAILGVVGLGLFTYRRYRNKNITRALR